jgi:hypothetical protein
MVLYLVMSAETRGAEPQRLTVANVTSSKVDMALTIVGRWGTFINGKSYQQMPLDTYKGWQYATYYDQERQLSIARRKLPKGSWEVIHFSDYIFKGTTTTTRRCWASAPKMERSTCHSTTTIIPCTTGFPGPVWPPNPIGSNGPFRFSDRYATGSRRAGGC